MKRQLILFSHSPEQTRRIGQVLGSAARPGEWYLVQGEIGSGKTTLVQGIAEGVGYTGQVTSPTFTLIHEYRGGRHTLVHADLYRIERTEQLRELDLEEYTSAGAVLVVEWPELLLAEHPKSCIVSLAYANETARRIEIRNPPRYCRSALETLSLSQAERRP